MLAVKTRMTISELPAGAHATILSFHGGRMVNNRLASLGFTPGVEVLMTQNFGHGPLIVTVRGTQVALGRGEASRIIVESRPFENPAHTGFLNFFNPHRSGRHGHHRR